MSLPLLNNAESVTAGATVTAANSGGTNANAFATPVIGANITLTADNAAPAHGVNAFKFALTSTATAITYLHWSPTEWGSAVAHIYGAFYFRTNVTSIASTLRLVSFLKAGALVGRIGVTNGNQGFQFRNSADATTNMGAVSGALSANTWYRAEFDILCGASGSGTINVYVGDSATLQGTTSFTGQAFGTDIDEIRFGFNTANFSSTSGDYILIDDINVNSTGLPGPGPYSAGAVDPTQNTNFSATVDTEFALRFEVQETGGASAALPGLHLYAQKNLAGGYTRVTTSSSGLKVVATGRFVDGAATTDLLTAGTGTFVAGEGDENGAVGAITIGASGHTEVEFSLIITASEVTIGDYWDVRLYKSDGAVLDSYTVTPRVTAAAAAGAPTIVTNPTSLTFTATEGGGNPVGKNLDVSNTGGGTLAFTVSDDAAWLSVSPTSGTAPATIVASVVTGSLTAAGSPYTGTITITDSGGTATNTPLAITVTFTVNAPGAFPVEIGGDGVWAETSNQLAPILAPNGGIYVWNEQPAPPTTTNSPGAMRKSTDGGSTWVMQDLVPDVFPGDHESNSIRLVGTDIHVFWQRSGYYAYRHVFDTTTDTYSIVNEVVQGTSRSATDQVATQVVRSDGTTVVVYTLNATQLCYRIRSAGGTWGSEVVLDSEAAKDFSQAFVEKSAIGDVVHIAYENVTDGILYYRSLSAADVLSARTQITTGLYAGTSNTFRKAMPNQGIVVWSNAGVDRMYVAYRKLDGKLYGRQLDGTTPTIGAEESISSGFVFCSPAGIQSFQMVGVICPDPATGEVYAIWSDAPTSSGGSQAGGNQLHMRVRSAAGTWGSETTPHNAEPIAAYAASVLTISSVKQLCVFYDEFTGVDPGISKYTRFLLSNPSLPVLNRARRNAHLLRR
jgi:hypothetical protein